MSKQLSALALAVAALVVATARPSTAVAGPLVYRKATTTIPAYSHEGVGRPCPFGSEVTGGGGALLGADSPDSQLVELTPYDATGSPGGPRDGYLAGGYNGAEVERQVKTIAICLRRGTARLAPAVASTQIPARSGSGVGRRRLRARQRRDRRWRRAEWDVRPDDQAASDRADPGRRRRAEQRRVDDDRPPACSTASRERSGRRRHAWTPAPASWPSAPRGSSWRAARRRRSACGVRDASR